MSNHVEANRRLKEEGDVWREPLSHKDWLYDGRAIKGRLLECFNRLDWSKAWVDLGPSPGGNFGPYWHVPLPEFTDDEGDIWGDTVHRLYPKIVTGKWLPLIRRAVLEYHAKHSAPTPQEGE